jgi:hypothetical protein
VSDAAGAPPGNSSAPDQNRLHDLRRRFEAAADEFAGVDAVVVRRPDVREIEAESLAGAYSRVFQGGQGDLGRIARGFTRRDPPPPAGESARDYQKLWVNTVCGSAEDSSSAVWTYSPENPDGGRVPLADLPDDRPCLTYSTQLLSHDAIPSPARRRLLGLIGDAARLILGVTDRGDTAVSRWLIHLADRPEPLDPAAVRWALIWRVPHPPHGAPPIPWPPAWEPYTAEDPKTDWWAVRLNNVCRLSRDAVEQALSKLLSMAGQPQPTPTEPRAGAVMSANTSPPPAGRLEPFAATDGVPEPGGGGYFAEYTPAGDRHNGQVVCAWDVPGETYRVCAGGPDYLIGWRGEPPPGCDWLPVDWPADHFPLGPDPRQLRGWLDHAEFLLRDLSEHAYGPLGPDDRVYGWRAALRAARQLAARYTTAGGWLERPLPAEWRDGLAEILTVRDAVLAAVTAGGNGPTGQPRPNPNRVADGADRTGGAFAALGAAAERLRLVGNERAIVNRLCERNGRVPLADLAALCEWSAPWDGTWNAARGRLNKKLRRHGWRLTTFNREAVAEPLPGGARK